MHARYTITRQCGGAWDGESHPWLSVKCAGELAVRYLLFLERQNFLSRDVFEA